MATPRADSQAAVDAAAAAAKQTTPAPVAPPAVTPAPVSLTNPITTTITSPGGSSTVVKKNTIATNQAIIDAYIAAHPAPPGTHYSQTLGADGKPVLYNDWSTQNAINAAKYGKVAGPSGVIAPTGSSGSTGSSGATGATGPVTTVANTQNALALLNSVLSGYGLDVNGSISNAILGLLQKNYDAPTIQALIEDPASAKSSDPNVAALANAWATRFSGNVARQAAGLTPLSPADYISTENSYKAVMAKAGMPAAAMDPAYFGKLMGVDVSPAEAQMRVNAAMTALNSEDPFVISQLQQQFGLSQSALALHLLDPSLAANVVQQQVTAAQIGAEAQRAGVGINYNTGAFNAMTLAGQGVTQAQAQQGFQNIAAQQPAMQQLASMYQGYGTAGGIGQQLQTATFGTPGTETQAEAEARLQRIRTQEVSQFSGSSGAGKGSLYGTTEGLQ